MKKNWKKSLINLGITTTIAIPISTAISCSSLLGSNGKYDSYNDNKVVIQTAWSSTSPQLDVLKDIVNKYNTLQKDKPGFMRVQIEKVQGGYGTIPSQAITKIQSRDTKTLPNLYIDYPTAVGMIAPYQMTYDTSDVIKRDWFEELFVEENDKISSIKAGGLYSIPLAKSTEAIAINKPLMKYIFKQLELVGVTSGDIASAGKNIKKIYETTITSADRGQIVSQWGKIDTTKAENVKDKIKINEKMFENYNDLFNFINKVQPLFENLTKPNILGLDSSSNLFYVLANLINKNNQEKFLFTKNEKTGYVDYKFLKGSNPTSNLFKTIYDNYFKKSLDKGSLWVGDSGEYGSNRLKQHQLALSIGSTAGLHYAYEKATSGPALNKNEVSYSLPIIKLYDGQKDDISSASGKTDWDKISTTITQGPSFNTIHINKKENEATKQFLKWFYQSPAVDFNGKAYKPIDLFSEKSSYIVPIKGAFEDDSTIGKKVSSKDDIEDFSYTMIGVKASFETIKRVIKDSKNKDYNASIVVTPVDGLTNSIRKMIDSQINASSNSKDNGANSYTKETLWGNMERQAIIDQTIDGDGKLSNRYIYSNMKDRNFSDINWAKYSYVDAIVDEWKDGDTPVVTVLGLSSDIYPEHKSVKEFKVGQKLNIRISGIDTPESNLKMADLRYKTQKKVYRTIDEKIMEKIIKKYEKNKSPLVNVGRFVNKLSLNKKSRFNYWKNIWVSIASKKISIKTPSKKVIEKFVLDPPPRKSIKFPNSNTDFTKVKFMDLNGVERTLLSQDILREGYWGNQAKKFGNEVVPKGTKVRIATSGAISYNRIVGSLFYGKNLSKNYSVEIVKTGKTMPLISNPSDVLNKNSIFWHIGQAIADAFNYALNKNIGLFKVGKTETLASRLKKILLTHGVPNYETLMKSTKGSTIYDYMSFRKPDRTLYKEGK